MMKALLEGVPSRLGPETKYGLGVIIRPTAHGVTYGHSGYMPGYQTEVMYFPELKAAIAVQVTRACSGQPAGRFALSSPSWPLLWLRRLTDDWRLAIGD